MPAEGGSKLYMKCSVKGQAPEQVCMTVYRYSVRTIVMTGARHPVSRAGLGPGDSIQGIIYNDSTLEVQQSPCFFAHVASDALCHFAHRCNQAMCNPDTLNNWPLSPQICPGSGWALTYSSGHSRCTVLLAYEAMLLLDGPSAEHPQGDNDMLAMSSVQDSDAFTTAGADLQSRHLAWSPDKKIAFAFCIMLQPLTRLMLHILKTLKAELKGIDTASP